MRRGTSPCCADDCNRLGFDYGDFDAHNGLWEMAEKTAHDGLTRMALVPRVLEARGLDVTPAMITKLRALRDEDTVAILEVILREEIAHVAAGSRWFRWYCERAGISPESRFRELLSEYAQTALNGPFNLEARSAAGFSDDELRDAGGVRPALIPLADVRCWSATVCFQRPRATKTPAMAWGLFCGREKECCRSDAAS